MQTRSVPFCSQCGTSNPDVAKFCFACGSALVTTPPPQEFRKTVTIVFSDLKGSTAMGERLDSESLREVMTRYFDAMRAELEQHGGVVEKFIGDAIMAVFGLPTLHEDDALRAVRAAAGMQRALTGLNDDLERHWGVRLTVRTGVNTGEVVAGDPTAGQRLVTGDAVNVAARLEQAAGAQEVLLGDLTYRLVRDYVDVEEVEPLELKGKAERVPAFRLVGVREDAERPRRLDAPMVGRAVELELLCSHLEQAIEGRCCRLATVLGEAGVGKSRLLDELILTVADEAIVLRGRCLPYGDGITFWPLAEAVRAAAQISERDTTPAALEKLAHLAQDADVRERVASAMGLSAAPFPVAELVWGARKLLQALGRERPVLALFEDIHWAESTFLDLLEQIVDQVADAQLLVVCTARPDFVERYPEWSMAPEALRLELHRLTADETAVVAEHLLGATRLDESIRARVAAAAEGNPLFIEQLVSMLIDEGTIHFEAGEWRPAAEIESVAVPPTIHALLAARLDRLAPDERSVVEPASVIGHHFVRDAVEHLTPERARLELEGHLGSLTDKQLIERDLSRSEELGYRFHHILIRDTAYEGILKRARATYHEQFVEWADSVNREGATEYEEILGYHLEQAHRYLAELGPMDEHGLALGAEASTRLAAAGRRAFARGDVPAAANLLGRAASLLPEESHERLQLLPEHGEALLQLGRFQEADAVLEDAVTRGDEVDARQAIAHASLVRLLVRLRTGDNEGWLDEAATTIAESMAVFEELGDQAGLAKSWRLLAWSHGTACHFSKAAEASERALYHAEIAADVRQQSRAATAYAVASVFGPTPLEDALGRCEQMLEQVAGDRHAQGLLLAYLGSLQAMSGSFDEARALVRRGRAMLEDLGLDVESALVDIEAWRIESLAHDPGVAERELRRAYDSLSAVGEKFILSTAAGLLAQVQYALERVEEAEQLGLEAKALATRDDIDSQALWRCVLSKVAARRGRFDQGEALVREALDLLEPTDGVLLKYGALLDLAEVFRLARRQDEARAALTEAQGLAEGKGSEVMSSAARALRAALDSTLVS
jgi:class 3 adenylate cyclase/tetratricopeptide (TPR) repeat protein